MKQLATILLAGSFAVAVTAFAKQDNKNKSAAPKSKPVQVQKQQHINVGPQVHDNVKKQKEIRKTTNLQSKELKVNKAPKLEKNIAPNTNVVATDKLKKNLKTATLPKEKLDQIRAQHLNFKAKPNAKIASVTFNQNYQIAGAQNWTGPQYQAFVSYRPQWHDQTWWRSSRYSTNILLIGGGWYYWDAGYWYPAWGYDESASYYPYDGPIYVGDNPRPFDQVVADCQATLQEQGYYKGEVDGLMGPLTREALASFQQDHGLITTAALDQPTLSSLGLG